MIEVSNKQISDELLKELKRLKPFLSLDQSNYAKGRWRAWIISEYSLLHRDFRPPQIRSSLLWNFAREVWNEAEIGLLTYSGDENASGISLHRDAGYADFPAVGVNLTGTCKFIYIQSYPGYEYSPPTKLPPPQTKTVDMEPGTVVKFNCKNQHSAEPSKERWGLNLWKISNKMRPQFEEYLRKQK